MATRYASAPRKLTFAFIRQVASVPGCWLFKTSATSWPLTFWPWKWCPSHGWRGLPLCHVPTLVFLGLSVLELGPMYATDRQTSNRRQTKASLNASALWWRRHNKSDINILTCSWNCIYLKFFSVSDAQCIRDIQFYVNDTSIEADMCKRQGRYLSKMKFTSNATMLFLLCALSFSF